MEGYEKMGLRAHEVEKKKIEMAGVARSERGRAIEVSRERDIER